MEALHELARKNNALFAKLITIAMERVCGTSRGCDRVRHYPATSASAIPTLTTERPPTMDASQAISRTSDTIDLHIVNSRHYCADEPGLRLFGSPRFLGLSTEKQRPLQTRAGVGGKQYSEVAYASRLSDRTNPLVRVCNL